VASASLTRSMSALLLCAASFPPFRSNPLAEAIAKAATWGKESGRDSKMTNKTPMGTVIWVRSSPSASLVLLRTRPTLLWLESAICFNPTAKLRSLAGVRERRESNGFASPDFVASDKSFALASRISDCFDSKRSARVCTQEARCSGVRVCSSLPPERAEINAEMRLKAALGRPNSNLNQYK
jgi:hypothetical protein